MARNDEEEHGLLGAAAGMDSTAGSDIGGSVSGGGVSSIKKRFEELAVSSPKRAAPPPRPKAGPRQSSFSSIRSVLIPGGAGGVQQEGRGELGLVEGETEARKGGRPRSLSGPLSPPVVRGEELDPFDGQVGRATPPPELRSRPHLGTSSLHLSASSPQLHTMDTETKAVTGSPAPPLRPSVRPVPPLSTRPVLPPTNPSTTPRKVAPPPPASRKPSIVATLVHPPLPPQTTSDTQVQTLRSNQIAAENAESAMARAKSEAPTGSVKALASRFKVSPFTPSTTRTPTDALMDVAPSSSGLEAFSQAAEANDRTRIGSSSLPIDSLRSPPIPARPVVPPRPSPASFKSAAIVAVATTRLPPPVPVRVGVKASATVAIPVATPSITYASTPDLSLSPPLPARIVAVPPPRKASSPLQRTVPLPPPRPILSATHTAPPSLAPSDAPYLPPPPPSRTLAANERLAPQRPALSLASSTHSGEESSDDEEDEAFTRSQEFPDATFANRRPPVVRDRRALHPTGQYYSFASKGRTTVTGQHHVYVWKGGVFEAVALPGGEHKVHAVEFRGGAEGEEGRYVWGGTKEGHVFEVDTIDMRISNVRLNVHPHPVVAIYRLGNSMISLDESGKLLTWGSHSPSSPSPDLTDTPKVQRLSDKPSFIALIGSEIWTSTGPLPSKTSSSLLSSRSPQIRIYDPTGRSSFLVVPRPITTSESAGPIGSVTASSIVPSQPSLIYLGHENGYVSVWNRETYTCVLVQRVSPYMITAMVGVGRYLWAGFRTGVIYVYEVEVEPWTVKKAWKAHKEAVTKLVVDPASLEEDGTLVVVSSGSDAVIQFWDGFLRDDWLDAELHLRQPEYCTFRTIRSLHISWNIDASKPIDLVGPSQNVDFLYECLTSVEGPDIISFGFQEMIDLENKKLTAKSMLFGKKKDEQKLSDGVSSSYRLWHDRLVQAVRLAMPPECPYTVVHTGDMVGLFSCIFVKNSERAGLRDVALTTVKTGMGGRYGNKGAILARFVIADTSILFINVHLAAGQAHRRQRDHDLVDILEDKSGFSELGSSSPGAYAAGGAGTTVFDHELCFLSGDLNYRIDARRDHVLAQVKVGAYEGLLANDQLLKGLATNQSFRLRSFKEQPITFAPTYKYDPGTDNYDNSVKKRIPAWCDRILYRADHSEKITPISYRRYECNVSDHRPISAAFDLRIKTIGAEKRATVWSEVEMAWSGVQMDLLARAEEFYNHGL